MRKTDALTNQATTAVYKHQLVSAFALALKVCPKNHDRMTFFNQQQYLANRPTPLQYMKYKTFIIIILVILTLKGHFQHGTHKHYSYASTMY